MCAADKAKLGVIGYAPLLPAFGIGLLVGFVLCWATSPFPEHGTCIELEIRDREINTLRDHRTRPESTMIPEIERVERLIGAQP